VTYQLHLGIGDDLADRVKSYAAEYGISIADAVRILLRQALKGEQQ